MGSVQEIDGGLQNRVSTDWVCSFPTGVGSVVFITENGFKRRENQWRPFVPPGIKLQLSLKLLGSVSRA